MIFNNLWLYNMCNVKEMHPWPKHLHIHRHSYFRSKLDIWNVNCAWATALISDTWTSVLVESVKFFLDRKYLEPRTRTPNLRIHAECCNHLRYSGPHICCPMFLNTGSGSMYIHRYIYVLSKITVTIISISLGAIRWLTLGKCGAEKESSVIF